MNNKYQVEIIPEFNQLNSYPIELRDFIENIISWRVSHSPEWYERPGRTFFVIDSQKEIKIKIKGAGYYNPPNISFSGLKRTISPIPESPIPLPPLENAFKRDLIHVDPSDIFPHKMLSVKSNYAPVGGMTIDLVENDQIIFETLNKAGLPSNTALSAFKYKNLFLNKKQMGTSLSILPIASLPITPYDIYISWYEKIINKPSLKFLKNNYENEEFSINNPNHRLKIVSDFAKVAGRLLFKFTVKAKLYRFSGSPDNWNIKADIHEPLFFSDVDTVKSLEMISKEQHAWEFLRNLLSSIHQWTYFFIPALSYSRSGYNLNNLIEYDFIGALLEGFFINLSKSEIKNASLKIWSFIEPVFNAATKNENIPLRKGEHFLENHFSRPEFYFIILNIISNLIEDQSKFDNYPLKNISAKDIKEYILLSRQDSSHYKYFENYSINNLKVTLNE